MWSRGAERNLPFAGLAVAFDRRHVYHHEVGERRGTDRGVTQVTRSENTSI